MLKRILLFICVASVGFSLVIFVINVCPCKGKKLCPLKKVFSSEGGKKCEIKKECDCKKEENKICKLCAAKKAALQESGEGK